MRTAYIALVSLALSSLLAAAPINNVAGTGKAGSSGDGGPAASAELHDPCGLVVGPDGAIYVCDTANHVVRRIASDRTIATVVGTGQPGYTGDGGPAKQATLNEPYEVRFDRSGNLFVVERLNHTVRRVDHATGVITTVAGTGKPGFSGDDGPANKAQLRDPHSIQFGPDGLLYIADVLNHRVRRVDMSTGMITTFAGTGEKKPPTEGAKLKDTPLHGPRALDFGKGGDLYLALREGNSIWRVSMKDATIHHIAGTGKKGFTGNDGPAKSATLSGPKGIDVAPDGAIYFADTESHTIRFVDPKAGAIHVVAGTGEKGDGPADGVVTSCKLNRPHGVCISPDGALLIGDSGNNRVREVRLTND
jgi:streptogramin lyase